MRLLDYHAWINGKALRWADDLIDFEEFPPVDGGISM